MKTLNVETSNGYFIACPLCNKIIDTDGGYDAGEDYWNDDYVMDNCLLYCGECGEILLCQTPCNGNDQGLGECIQEISNEDAKLKFPKIFDSMTNGLSQGEDDKIICRIISVLKISDVICSVEIDNSEEWEELTAAKELEIIQRHYHHLDSPVINLKDAAFDTSHDGIFLYYRGECTECGRIFNSKIWGD